MSTVTVEVLCPLCDGKMIERDGARGPFYGCSSYPRCRGTRQMEGERSAGPSKGWSTAKASSSDDIVFGSDTDLLKGSPQQEAIWKKMINGTSHLVIDAVAGSGKSTTIVEGIKRINPKYSISVLAFNAHIAREMNGKLKAAGVRHANALTYNSAGWRAVRRAFPNVRLMDDKLETIIEEMVPESDYKVLAGPVAKMVRLLKCHLFHEGTLAQMEELNSKFDMDVDSNIMPMVLDYAPRILKESIARTSVADFDDQVYWTVLHKLPIDTSDIVMVDEAQDTSLMQQEMVMMMRKPFGRIFVVGDKHQAIYGFRGADATAIARMKEALERNKAVCEEMPLSVSRRCPVAHVKLAQKIVPHITAMPTALEGEIVTTSPEKATGLMRPGDLAICRVNAPLIGACYTLIRQGVRAIVRGRDIGKGLLALLRRLKASSIPDLVDKLRQYESKEMAKLVKMGRKGSSMIVTLQDKIDCLVTLCEGTNDLSELQQRIDKMFSDFDESGKPKDFVVFSTVHRAKGLEAANVFILSPELIPHPMSKMAWEQEQELNLAYVAVTRSKYDLKTNRGGRLVFCGQVPPAFGGPPPPKQGKRPGGMASKDKANMMRRPLEDLLYEDIDDEILESLQ